MYREFVLDLIAIAKVYQCSVVMGVVLAGIMLRILKAVVICVLRR